MGFKLKSLVSHAIPAVSSAVGAYFGGPLGASSGYQVGNMVNGAVGLGGDGLSSSDKAAARYQMRLANEQADYAFNKNLQMWNLNNAYNDPSAQMARLKAAGLNANLVYGGGNVTGNTSGSSPTYDNGSVSFTDKRVQRQQLALALQEHQQRITNQAIENELARERIGLASREADRQDRLADAQIKAYASNLGLGIEKNDLTREHNSLLSEDRRYKRWSADHDKYLRHRSEVIRSYPKWSFMSEREKYQILLRNGLGREPQLRDYK